MCVCLCVCKLSCVCSAFKCACRFPVQVCHNNVCVLVCAQVHACVCKHARPWHRSMCLEEVQWSFEVVAHDTKGRERELKLRILMVQNELKQLGCSKYAGSCTPSLLTAVHLRHLGSALRHPPLNNPSRGPELACVLLPHGCSMLMCFLSLLVCCCPTAAACPLLLCGTWARPHLLPRASCAASPCLLQPWLP